MPELTRTTAIGQPDPARRSGRVAAVLAAAALVLETPVLVWWLVGDMTTTPSDPDYLIHPPHVDAATETAMGLVSLGIWVAALVVFVIACRGARLQRGWWLVLGSLLTAGAIVGWGERGVTMGVVGANIGGGIVLYAGTPIVVGLVGFAAVVAAKQLWAGRSEPD